MARSIRVGAVDWRQPAWAGSFYPADLPEEWRLTFYASQFNCVFLPAKAWHAVETARLKQWCDDVHDKFVFLLQSDEISSRPEALGNKWLWVDALDERIHWFDKQSDLKRLASAIRATGADADVFLVSRDGDLAQMERVHTLLELMGY